MTDSSSQTLVKLLSQVLAETYTLMLQTQNAHWNIEGIHFAPLHELFGEQYDEYFAAIDVLAENIRMLGAYAPGSFAEFQEVSGFAHEPSIRSTSDMLKTLATQTTKVLQTINALQQAAADTNTAIEDLAIERQRAHLKHLWMLESSLK